MLYGNLMNRIMENDEGTNDIKVGTRLTEYLYSDRNVWEVIEVKSKKNVVIRELSAKHNVAFSNNDVELFSDENNRVMELVLDIIIGMKNILIIVVMLSIIKLRLFLVEKIIITILVFRNWKTKDKKHLFY